MTCSREAAARYYQTLQRLNAPECALIISFPNDDESHIARYRTTKEQQRRLIERFKDKDDPLAILVVCDMLITGFDAPVEQVMYLDSPLKEHTLLQAIARVNRPAEGKYYGLIVDYWGIAEDLSDALAIQAALDNFDPEEVQGALRLRSDLQEQLEGHHRSVLHFFQEVDHTDLEACVLVIEPEEIRLQFETAFRAFARSLDQLYPDPEALRYEPDLKWLSTVRQAARNRFRDERLDLRAYSEKLRELVQAHLSAENVEQLLEPISIFADDFDERVAQLPTAEARASEIEHALRHEVHVRLAENPVFYQSLQERLEQLIQAYRQVRLSTVEHLRHLNDVAHEIRTMTETATEHGLSPTQYALYQLLSTPQSDDGSSRLSDATLKELAKSIEGSLRPLTEIIDWPHKEDIQRKMRQQIKSQLRLSHYPREQIESITARLMDLGRARMVA